METGGDEQGLRFLSAQTGAEWVCCARGGGSAQASAPEIQEHRQRLDQFLTELLLSEHLVVFAGLGTTLCLNQNGPVVAPTMQDLWIAAEQIGGESFEEIRTNVNYSTPPGGDNVEVLLSQCQLLQALRPSPQIADFIARTEAMIVERCRFVRGSTSLRTHEGFLRKVARRSTRQPRTKVFTTNYDLCFETAASHARFTVIDGFSHAQPQEFDGSYFAYDLVRRNQEREVPDYIPNVFHLYKVHGSVDWELRDGQVVKNGDTKQPLIVYPRHTKFEASYQQPFLEMMSRFQAAIRQPNCGLLVIGFGFNDAHVWQPMLAALRSNVGLKALVVDPVLGAMTREPVRQITDLIESGDSRVALLAAGFEDLVPLLPDLVATTEEERHRERVRGMGGRSE